MLEVENGPSSQKIYLFLLLKPRRFRKSKQVHKRDKILEVKRQDIRKSVNFVLFHSIVLINQHTSMTMGRTNNTMQETTIK